ncbi:indolepyruvate oxidoreductase subunit beta family protein [Polaromonas sp.]|uniref:indolepyruvate oxidoreductase subunit beta family protein n=1 Tax=Polaromonas sp. TaxID=1869339 RepID=UPI002730D204|nr:indolepyruvate oxidoreductase subunit beta family protein [Polaromonas sp.]MDP1742840.1 indolepyruvate oxidoreductase subunit beta family protein [Polaromonas sp.]
MNTHEQKPITVLICALGGEGGGVLTEWLVDIARASGYAAQSTSIPGVAQRTGATTYYLEVFPVPLAELGGKRPVFSLNPVPGALDGLVSSELLETARQVGHGMSSPLRTLVISSSSRTLTTAERMVPGDGRTGNAPLLQAIAAQSRATQVFDMGAMAKDCGTVVSAVMLGAIAGSGLLPFAREAYESVIRHGGKGAEASLRGFAQAFEQVNTQQAQTRLVANLLSDQELPAPVSNGLEADLASIFPSPVHEMLALGHARMLEYQDRDYADLYVQRLQQVLHAEQEADPTAAHGYATTREMARWLALWMAFDDIVRVADLKSSASRWQRVHGEVKAGDGDLLQVYDHFKPGAAEFAALLPAGLAARVTRWDRKRVACGKAPWALPLKVGTHSVFGMLSLRLLASLKWLRVLGSRYATEQALIEQWLNGVVRGTRAHWQAGHEIALCGRLIKGYGSTNERGKDNLMHVLEHLATSTTFASNESRAAAIAQAREAALLDEAGKALDQTLVQHGAPARPVKAQPIRWVDNPHRKPGAVKAA